MKKFIAMLLVLVMAMSFAACGASEPAFDPLQKAEGTMTYAEYAAAALESPVVVECFVPRDNP